MLAYLEGLAREIGAQPRFWRRPALLPQLLLGPIIAARYRLDGLGKSKAAEDIVRRYYL